MKKFALFLATAMALTGFSACEKEDPTATEKRSGWLLTSAPAYMDGKLSYKTYKIGTGLDMDTSKSAGELQLIENTSRSAFETYLEKVEKNGYEEISRNEIEGNLFVEYEKDGNILYTYYVDFMKEARVIEDNASVMETAIEYSYELGENESTTIYQYAMMNDPLCGNTDVYRDNGMFYVIRQADGRLILIDGGNDLQATDRAVSELVDFLYEITGKSSTEKLEISALVLSHGHDDHKAFIHKLVKDHGEKLSVASAIYNMPFWQADATSGEGFAELGALLQEKFPDIKYVKPHTGQSIRLGEVQIDVLLTHEDLLESKVAMTQAKNFNNTTTVVRYAINGRTFLQLGDHSGSGAIESRFLGMYKNAAGDHPTLKSDIVQVAHHAMNDWMENLYMAIGARYALVPGVDCDFDQFASETIPDCYQEAVNDVIAANADVELYFQSRKTCAVTISKNGSITLSQSDILGANDDYAELIANYPAFVK